MDNTEDTASYWSLRYKENLTGWDLAQPSPPITAYMDQLKDKGTKILIPGAGNAYEAEYLFASGFLNTYILDIAHEPLEQFAERNPDFPPDQIIYGDFFQHQGKYDLILEQTFFCSFPPLRERRTAYAKKMSDLLHPKGKLVGLWFDFPLTGDMEKRPFGGSKSEYLEYFTPHFFIKTFEPAYNSISPRMGNELFGIFEKAD